MEMTRWKWPDGNDQMEMTRWKRPDGNDQMAVPMTESDLYVTGCRYQVIQHLVYWFSFTDAVIDVVTNFIGIYAIEKLLLASQPIKKFFWYCQVLYHLRYHSIYRNAMQTISPLSTAKPDWERLIIYIYIYIYIFKQESVV